MAISIILLVLWLAIGIVHISGKVELTKADYIFTWIALMLTLIKEVVEKM